MDPAGPAPDRVGKDGALALVFERRGGRTVLTRSRYTLPLQVMAPVDLDDPAAVVSVLNPTGGLVGGDRLTIDVAEGEKIPRKGGPGITRSDLLVINKIDLAPHVGADLGVMERDSRRMRGARPFVFTNLRTGEGMDAVLAWIRHELLLTPA